MENYRSTLLATALLFTPGFIDSPFVPEKYYQTDKPILTEPYQSPYSEFALSEGYFNQEEMSEILVKFGSGLLDGMKDNPPEYSKVIDEHFWELF